MISDNLTPRRDVKLCSFTLLFFYGDIDVLDYHFKYPISTLGGRGTCNSSQDRGVARDGKYLSARKDNHVSINEKKKEASTRMAL